MAMKFPTRKTLARMSRSMVEERIEAMGIELPPRKLPRDYDELYDNAWFSNDGKVGEVFGKIITREEFEAGRVAWETEKAQSRAARLAKHLQDQEHPDARSALFTECLKRAIERAGLSELNKLLNTHYREVDPPIWTQWTMRTATRLQREKAVMDILSKADQERPTRKQEDKA